MTAPLASAADEEPLYLRVGADDIFGVYTRPTGAPNRTGVLLLWGSGNNPTPGRNQVRTQFARRLAAHGYSSLRIDYRGVGESSGELTEYRFDDPPLDEVRAGIDLLRRKGAERLVVLAHCVGGRNFLELAHDLPDLAAAVLIAPPVRDDNVTDFKARKQSSTRLLRRLVLGGEWRSLRHSETRRRARDVAKAKLRAATGGGVASVGKDGQVEASPRFMKPLAALLDREIPVLVVYGDHDNVYRVMRRARHGRLGALLDRHDGRLRFEVLAGRVHGFTQVSVQEQVLDLVEEWLGSVDAGSR